MLTKGFLKFCEGQNKANEGEIPVMVFNPHPYEIEGEFEASFLLQNQNWTDGEYTYAKVYDENGNELLSQNEKPECTIHLDWTKKVSFVGKIAPSSITRFNCKLTTLKNTPEVCTCYDGDFIKVENNRMKAVINKKTGLIDSYVIDGKEYINGILNNDDK